MRDKACGSGDGRSHFTAPTARAHAHCDRALSALGTDPHVGPTDVTLRACAAARTNRCLHMRDTKPSEETSDTVQISNVQYNETRRETAAECCAIRGNGQGRARARAASSPPRGSDRTSESRPSPSPSTPERPGTCTEARSGARPCGGGSPRRGTDALSNFLTRYRTWVVADRSRADRDGAARASRALRLRGLRSRPSRGPGRIKLRSNSNCYIMMSERLL